MKNITNEPRYTCNAPVRYVAYFRVSTQRQGKSGLGLDAQQVAVSEFIANEKGDLIESFIEVESGRKSNRPKLEKAIQLAKKQKATLVIAKLDRLARNVHFITGLMAGNVDFVACDMPSANKLTIGILACVAEDEADRISQRTKAALAAARERGTELGSAGKRLAEKNKKQADELARKIYVHIETIRQSGVKAYAKIADELNSRGISTAKNTKWHGTSVMRVVKRIEKTA